MRVYFNTFYKVAVVYRFIDGKFSMLHIFLQKELTKKKEGVLLAKITHGIFVRVPFQKFAYRDNSSVERKIKGFQETTKAIAVGSIASIWGDTEMGDTEMVADSQDVFFFYEDIEAAMEVKLKYL